MSDMQSSKTSKHTSNYRRKHVWLARRGLWGFEVPEPKPWRGATDAASEFRANRPCRYAREIAEKIEALSKTQPRDESYEGDDAR